MTQKNFGDVIKLLGVAHNTEEGIEGCCSSDDDSERNIRLHL